jgi:Na+/H+-translocating membrane pyrophosphatase
MDLSGAGAIANAVGSVANAAAGIVNTRTQAKTTTTLAQLQAQQSEVASILGQSPGLKWGLIIGGVALLGVVLFLIFRRRA